MLTVVLLKLAYVGVGAIVGWLTKHFQVAAKLNSLPSEAKTLREILTEARSRNRLEGTGFIEWLECLLVPGTSNS